MTTFSIQPTPYFSLKSKQNNIQEKKHKTNKSQNREMWSLICVSQKFLSYLLSLRCVWHAAVFFLWRKLIFHLPAAINYKQSLGWQWDFLPTPSSFFIPRFCQVWTCIVLIHAVIGCGFICALVLLCMKNATSLSSLPSLILATWSFG